MCVRVCLCVRACLCVSVRVCVCARVCVLRFQQVIGIVSEDTQPHEFNGCIGIGMSGSLYGGAVRCPQWSGQCGMAGDRITFDVDSIEVCD